MVPEVGIEPTRAQGPQDFENEIPSLKNLISQGFLKYIFMLGVFRVVIYSGFLGSILVCRNYKLTTI